MNWSIVGSGLEHRADRRTVVRAPPLASRPLTTDVGRSAHRDRDRGSPGVGAATARLLFERGASVVLSDGGGDVEGKGLDPSVVEEASRAIAPRGSPRIATDCRDLSARGAADALAALALERFGRIDAVVHCAGALTNRPAARGPTTSSSTAPSGCRFARRSGSSRAAAPKIIEQKDGAFVLVTGPSAFFGMRGHAAEAAGHAATIAMTRSAALELRKHNVRVNAVVPSARTRLTEHLPLYKSVADGAFSPRPRGCDAGVPGLARGRRRERRDARRRGAANVRVSHPRDPRRVRRRSRCSGSTKLARGCGTRFAG